MRAPVRASKRVLVSASSGAAPEKQMRIDLKVDLLLHQRVVEHARCRRVGTPLKNVGLTRRTSSSTAVRSRGFGTSAKAQPIMNATIWTPTLA
jgi:hypothetical protein